MRRPSGRLDPSQLGSTKIHSAVGFRVPPAGCASALPMNIGGMSMASDPAPPVLDPQPGHRRFVASPAELNATHGNIHSSTEQVWQELRDRLIAEGSATSGHWAEKVRRVHREIRTSALLQIALQTGRSLPP